jgi:hypothetical protein
MNNNNQPIGILIQELEELPSGKQSMNLPNEKIYLADSKMHLMDKNLKKEIAL